MFPAYTPSLNAGRFDEGKVYTLANILRLRNSLDNGIVPGTAITVVPGEEVTLDSGIDFLLALMKANTASEGGKPRAIDGTTADVIIDRLELLRGTKGQAVADGNTRSLAILLHYGITGFHISYPTVECGEGDPRVASFRANVSTGMAIKMEWKARTAFVMSLIQATPNISESEIMRTTGLGRGVSQHATASAVAIIKHRLNLSWCVGLTAADWRTVRDAGTAGEAEAIAYNDGTRPKSFSVKQEAATFLKRNGDVGIYAALLTAIVEDDLEGFRKTLVLSLDRVEATA